MKLTLKLPVALGLLVVGLAGVLTWQLADKLAQADRQTQALKAQL